MTGIPIPIYISSRNRAHNPDITRCACSFTTRMRSYVVSTDHSAYRQLHEKVRALSEQPPCISTICLAMASPRPMPPLALVLELSTWWNCSKICAWWSSGMPGPVSATLTLKWPATAFCRHPYLAHVGELDGVAHKFEEDLREALLITDANG